MRKLNPLYRELNHINRYAKKKNSLCIFLWFHLGEGLECSVRNGVVGEGVESKCDVVVVLKLGGGGPQIRGRWASNQGAEGP